ncbi:hypothetical protein FGB62_16g265 [Gracilaria domingensis]|nr:hypothetical protein FGB62_16g265 [Gracilaria domingensis]
MRTLLSDFEQIHKVNQTPLTDSRIRHIRNHVEKGMPRLYSLQQQMMNHSSSEASRILFMAEDCLRRFPDVDDAFLRSLKPPPQAKPPESASSHHQPRFPSLYSVPSSYSSKPPLRHANPSVNTSNAPPPTAPSTHNYHYYPQPSTTSHQHESFPAQPPPVRPTVTDHRPSLTPSQQMLLHSVHSLSSNYRQPFAHNLYEAPAAMSPMEIESISAAVNRETAFSSGPPGVGAINSGGYAYGHAHYASRREADAPRYHAWGAVKSRHESSLYADTPRSGSNIRHRRSNSNDE